MNFATMSSVPRLGPWMTEQPQPERERKKRILAALGQADSQDLRVGPQSLARYYDYLAAHLELPFAVCYPPPSTPAEALRDRCQVVELLDPRTALGDEFDGIFCRTRKGRFQVNLPLVELTVLPPSKNVELLRDYEYWFWHWRE
jgi:hypothetical protein